MKYMSFIFENQDVRNTVAGSEAIVEVASNAIINANIVLEDYIYANLARFTAGADSLADIYENIRNFVISENVALYSQYSEILSDNELSPQQKAACFYENVDLPGSTIDNPMMNADPLPTDPSTLHRIQAMSANAMRNAFNHSQRAADYIKAQGQAAIDYAKIQGRDVADFIQTNTHDAVAYAQANPYTTAGMGAAGLGVAGLGAYGAYRAFKNRKHH